MKEHPRKFYVTTPIYYVTARPHLGSLYSTILADVAARWHKLRGVPTFFLTGTDEHGQKIAQAATKAGMDPRAFVDQFIDAYKDMWAKYSITYSYFVRTSGQQHTQAVQHWIRHLLDTGDIYKAHYTGYYCTPCETYVVQKDAGVAPPCESCGRLTVELSEESYFFKLSAYQDTLLAFYKENPDFITPKERAQEVIRFVEGGLKDLSISRTTITWGIPFPGDDKHVVYVWADALLNYISAVGYAQQAKQDELARWWPADMQILGKDIVRFHAIYWPAFLMAAGLSCPRKLLVHGWLLHNEQKMSKSFGNVVEPQALLDAYGADSVRYYLSRYMTITHDSEFSTHDLEAKHNSDLANDLGNLLQRVSALANKRDLYEVVPPANWGRDELDLRDEFWTMLEQYSFEMDEGYFYRALAHVWNYIHKVNSYFHAQEPWKVKDTARFQEIVSATCHSLYAVSHLIWPIMPNKMEQLLAALGVTMTCDGDRVQDLDDNPWNRTFMIHDVKEPLFKKFDLAPPQEPVKKEPAMPEITIDDVAKVVQLVGTINEAHEVEGSDKLLKLQVDFGEHGTKQVLSGIKKHFGPQDVLNTQAVFIVNLKPRKMMGLLSEAMILTVTDADNKLKLVSVEGIPNGTRLK